jgi:hypothetical protein
MGTILWNNPAQGIQEFTLKPGVNTVGRTEDNDIYIPDDSVSSHHGEIVFADGQITLRDLGSTNGSYVNGQPVQEVLLQTDQSFRLGGVDLIFKNPAAVVAATPAPAAAPVRVGLRVQVHKPEPAAEAAPAAAPVSVAPPMVKPPVAARPLPRGSNMLVKPGPPTGSFYSQIGSSFTYPAKQGGLFLLICGTIFFAMLDFATTILSAAGIFFLVQLALTAASGGYMFAFMQSVITSTHNGDRDKLSWPDISSFGEDLFMPFLRFVAIWAFYLAPGMVGIYYFEQPLIGTALLFMGIICVPMVVLTVALTDSIGGLNPIVVLASIAKVPGQYLATCILFLVVLAISGGLEHILKATGIPILPALISYFIFLYGLTVQMRVLGLLYRYNEKKFNWF